MYYNENTQVFLNGEFIKAKDAKISMYSQTLHYGNGVFEGIRSYNTPDGASVFKAREHYERLHFSAKTMMVPLPYSVEELTEITYALLKKNNLKDAYIRPLAFMNENQSLVPNESASFFMAAWEWPKLFGDKLTRVMASSFQRPNPKAFNMYAKINGHYVNSMMAASDARKKGFDEALLMDAKDFVAEGPGANFFFEKNGKLFTAPLGNILPGITRATVMELCKDMSIPYEEKLFKIEEVYGSDGAFFCGTAAEVSGIASIDDKPFRKEFKDTFGAKLLTAYKKLVTKGLVAV